MPQADSAGARQGAAPPGVEEVDSRASQELWLALARRAWSSLVLVPAEPGVPVEQVAHDLARVGKRIGQGPVSAVTPNALEYATAAALADMPSFVGRRRLEGRGAWTTIDLSTSELTAIPEGAEDPARPDQRAEQAIALASTARLIISVPAVVEEPLGLAAVNAADLVVICVERGRTHLASVERTVRLIGRERVAGCVLL